MNKPFGTDLFENELREKFPGQAMKADYENSRAAAIDLNCKACAGSSMEARRCTTFTCFFHPFRPGADSGPKRPEGAVPTAAHYAQLLSERGTSEGNGDALREWRESQKNTMDTGEEGEEV